MDTLPSLPALRHLIQIVVDRFQFTGESRRLKLGGGPFKVPLCSSQITAISAEQSPRDLRACRFQQVLT